MNEVGQELDTQIAREVMRWRVITAAESETLDDVSDRVCVVTTSRLFGLGRYHQARSDYWDLRPWHPSTEIAAAWEVVEHLRTRGLVIELRMYPDTSDECVECSFDEHAWNVWAPTVPLAICRAALIVSGVENADDA